MLQTLCLNSAARASHHPWFWTPPRTASAFMQLSSSSSKDILGEARGARVGPRKWTPTIRCPPRHRSQKKVSRSGQQGRRGSARCTTHRLQTEQGAYGSTCATKAFQAQVVSATAATTAATGATFRAPGKCVVCRRRKQPIKLRCSSNVFISPFFLLT